MTMLANSFEQPLHPSRSRDIVEADAATTDRAMIKKLLLRALGVLTAGVLLAAIIGLDTAFYVRTLVD